MTAKDPIEPDDLPEGSGEDSDEFPTGPAEDDPRLRIPDVLREPARRPMSPEGGKDQVDTVEMGRAWATALNFVFTILAGAAAGFLFDRWRGTSPTATMIGLGAGFVLAFYQIIRATQRQERADRERKDRGRKP